VYEWVGEGQHHHLVCQKCGRVITIEHEEVQNFFSSIQQDHHFQVLTNHLILFGLCESCQAGEGLPRQEK
jgi:Fur family ferric uptake transcriptional regulator